MAQQTINVGSAPNDGTGDTLRDAGGKINSNFTELYGLSAGSSPYDFGFVFEATPEADAIVGRVRIGRDIIIPADMAGSSGGVSVNPAATFDVLVQDDGVTIGTISTSTGGAVTFTTVSGTEKSVAAGSEITFVAPNTPDTTVEGMSAVILATVDQGS